MTAVELLNAGQPFKALPIIARKAKKQPTVANLIVLGACQRACCHFDAAEATLLQLMGLTEGKSPEVLNNIAQLQTDRGNFTEAPILFRRALEVAETYRLQDSSQQQILLGLAYSLLRLQQFEYTWTAFEAGRLGVSWGALPTTKVWEGQKDSKVLIACEGGFGDIFLFSRWIPKVREISDRVGIVVWDKMINFCDWKILGAHDVLPMSNAIEAAKWEYTTSILSLPGIFKMRSLFDIPPDQMRNAHWETVAPSNRLTVMRGAVDRIGFCWRAEEMGVSRKVRSLDDVTALSIAKHLTKKAQTVSLCPRKEGLHKFDNFKVPGDLIQSEINMVTWRDTAAYMRSLDLVVTVDTAIWHLAGLLKVPTLLLVPCRSDWKQFTDMTVDPWYGEHVTWYRETNPERWTIEAIKEAIDVKISRLL